jgi:hypothetical protein
MSQEIDVFRTMRFLILFFFFLICPHKGPGSGIRGPQIIHLDRWFSSNGPNYSTSKKLLKYYLT